MHFAESRLYELLRWSIPAVIGFYLFLPLANEIKRPLLHAIFAWNFTGHIEQLDQLQEKKDAIIASSGYAQIDDIIAIEKQIMDVDNHNSMVNTRKNMINHGLSLLLGFLLMLLSTFVGPEAIRVIVAAIGAVFVGAGASDITNTLPLLSQMVIYLLCAISAYIIWHFLSKKYGSDRANRYIFLQLCGAFSLVYALVFASGALRDHFFTSEVIKFIDEKQKKIDLLEDEQRALLKNEQLNETQKERYIELTKMIDAALREDSSISSGYDRNWVKETMNKEHWWALIVAILYIFVGTVVRMPWLFSFGFISAGFMMLYGFFLLHSTITQSLLPIGYLIGAGILLLLVCYRLYYQRKSYREL